MNRCWRTRREESTGCASIFAKNGGLAAAAAVVILALLGGIAGGTYGIIQANKSEKAERQAKLYAERKREAQAVKLLQRGGSEREAALADGSRQTQDDGKVENDRGAQRFSAKQVARKGRHRTVKPVAERLDGRREARGINCGRRAEWNFLWICSNRLVGAGRPSQYVAQATYWDGASYFVVEASILFF